MGTEVKLKREAIERRIAELEGKMPDIQASKEGAEARATIRRLKARLKTYPQERKKAIYILVQAFDLNQAAKNLAEGMKGTVSDYEVASIVKTPIVDAYKISEK